jgi:hypothetical protein
LPSNFIIRARVHGPRFLLSIWLLLAAVVVAQLLAAAVGLVGLEQVQDYL